jgi:hypothetical protein
MQRPEEPPFLKKIYHEASGRSAVREAFQNNVSMVTTIIMKTKDEARFGISPTQIS